MFSSSQKSIIVPQNVVPGNLTITEEHLERGGISLYQGDENPNLVTGTYCFPYCSTFVVLLHVPKCLPSGKPFLQAHSLRGEFFIDQEISDVYKYHYDSKF